MQFKSTPASDGKKIVGDFIDFCYSKSYKVHLDICLTISYSWYE